jgi:hypothetical protein
MTDKQMVQAIAKKDGFHLPPKHYREQVRQRFRRDVSSATVTKAIGSERSRLKSNEPEMLTKARQLLSACYFEEGLACSMVSKAMKKI